MVIMPGENNVAAVGDLSLARSRVQKGTPPNWVTPTSYDSTFKIGEGPHVTILLFDSQIHAEHQSLFTHQVIRLESMQAVQRWSQWRLQFEPRTQLVTLHSLRIRRGDAE